MGGFAGIAAGLGGEGAQLERARQQRIVETLAQAQEKRTQRQADITAQRESAPESQLVTRPDGIYVVKRNPLTGEVTHEKIADIPGVARKPLGAPIKAGDGNWYQRYADDAGKITTERVEGLPGADTMKPDIREGRLLGIHYQGRYYTSTNGAPDEVAQAFQDINDKMALARYHTGYKLRTNADGTQDLVPITTTSGVQSGPSRPSTTGGGKPPGPSVRPGGGRGVIPFGAAPQARATINEAIAEVKRTKPMVDVLDASEAYMKRGQFSPRGDIAIIVRAVRAMNPGSVRLPIRELEMEIKAGSWGDRFKRQYDIATTGLLPNDQREDLMNVIRDETTHTAQSTAEMWQSVMPDRPLPPFLRRFVGQQQGPQIQMPTSDELKKFLEKYGATAPTPTPAPK